MTYPVTYTYKFKNGFYIISKGVTTNFDWQLYVKLNEGYIMLDKTKFLTRKSAINYIENILTKNNLM